MLIKECDRIKLEEGRRYCLSRTERAQFKEEVLIIWYRNRFYFLNEKEAQAFRGLQEPAGLQKSVIRRLNRVMVISLSPVRIDSRGRVSIPVSMRHKKRAR